MNCRRANSLIQTQSQSHERTTFYGGQIVRRSRRMSSMMHNREFSFLWRAVIDAYPTHNPVSCSVFCLVYCD